MVDINANIREELLSELMKVEEGTWEGEIIGIGEVYRTRAKEIPYVAIGVKVQEEELREFFVGSLRVLEVLKKCEPYLVGKKVMVQIKHKIYADRKYYDPKILWDEAFEELNGL